MDISLKQQAQANAVDTMKRMGQFQADVGQAKVAALNSGQQIPDMISNFQKASNALAQQHLTGTTDPANPNPPNRAVARNLQLAMAQHLAEQFGSFPTEAAERVHQDNDFRMQSEIRMASATIGQGIQAFNADGTPFDPSTAGPNDHPVFHLGADANSALNNPHGGLVALIDKGVDPTARPIENQYYHQLAARTIFTEGARAVAVNPALAPYLGDYLKQYATSIDPAQEATSIATATATMRRPKEMMDVANGNLDASLTQKYLQQVHEGNLDTAGLENAATHRLISPEHYQQITGYAFMPPGNPGAIAAMQKQIAATNDENDLETLRGTINGPMNAELYGKGAIPLNAAIENQKRQLTTVEGQQRRLDNDQIKRAFQSLPGVTAVGIGPDFYNRLAAIKGLPTMNDLRTNTINDYNALTYGVSDPAKLRASRVKAIQDNQPDLEAVGLGKYVKPATPPPPIRPLSADDARRVIRLAREKGYIP
ncbi:hypothetical protein [Candidatus Binatus sp.]|uniref:hypothetical protein n=1 Tax=Candidatus Binatus sp. TaxID=2811406 RepID=UPI003C394ACC